MTSILIVDDESGLRELLRINLENEGFTILQAENGMRGLEMIRERQPDLVVMDVMMPEMDGWEACTLLRKFSKIPVLMLTARVQIQDIVTGLEVGADDYLLKPFNMDELIARIRALLRRIPAEQQNIKYRSQQQRFINKLHDVINNEGLTLSTICIEGNVNEIISAIQSGAIVIPYAQDVIQIGQFDFAAVVPTELSGSSIVHTIDAFNDYCFIRQYRNILLSYGYSNGRKSSINNLIEAVANDFNSRRASDGLSPQNYPAILNLEKDRQKALRRYNISVAKLEEAKRKFGKHYTEDLMREEIDKLIAIVNHDLNSGFSSLIGEVSKSIEKIQLFLHNTQKRKRTLNYLTTENHKIKDIIRHINLEMRDFEKYYSRKPNSIIDVKEFLENELQNADQTIETLKWIRDQVTLCRSLQLSMLELGHGTPANNQPSDILNLLKRYISLLTNQIGTQINITFRGFESSISYFTNTDINKILAICLNIILVAKDFEAKSIQIEVVEREIDNELEIVFIYANRFSKIFDVNSRIGNMEETTPKGVFEQRFIIINDIAEEQNILVKIQMGKQKLIICLIFQLNTTRSSIEIETLASLRSKIKKLEIQTENIHYYLNKKHKQEIEITSEQARKTILYYLIELDKSLTILNQRANALNLWLKYLEPISARRIVQLSLYCRLLVRNLLLDADMNRQIMEIDINEQIMQVLGLLEHKLASVKIERKLNKTPLYISINSVEIKQVLMNLLKNAAEAIRGEGKIYIRTEQYCDEIHIYIKDNGIGIAPGNSEKIFQLSFSTKGRGSNTGVGLFAVQSIIEQASGHVSVASATRDATGNLVTWSRGFYSAKKLYWRNTGTVFHIALPLAKGVTSQQ